MITNPFTQQVLNANPRGCNQYSGEDCISSSSKERKSLKKRAKYSSEKALQTQLQDESLNLVPELDGPTDQLLGSTKSPTRDMKSHESISRDLKYYEGRFKKDGGERRIKKADKLRSIIEAHDKAYKDNLELHLKYSGR